eukprot:TRINITY_DN768_c0_g2_i1.p3 TRINITY_DN768_c0_g2~~TRINITY_DN768_c0_g2_i1.p3  ORF type:complete len:110 (+),score=48.58 TRINITY_DN768_c0_g2_i1:72-401(+)
MRDIAAYLLAVLGGNSSPSAADVKKILASVGVEPSDTLDALVKDLNGKDISEVLAEGQKKFAQFGGGGGAAAPAAGADAGGAAAGGAAAAAPAEEEESEDEDMGFGLFD